MNTKCYYPDWEGGMTVGEHSFDKEGWCITCAEYDTEADERPWDRFTRHELVKKVKQLNGAIANWQKQWNDSMKERASLQTNLEAAEQLATLNANQVVKMREELMGLYKELGRVPNGKV